MSEASTTTVTLDKKLTPVFAAVGAALGLGVSLAIEPVVGWLMDLVGDAPAPLRLLDQLPLAWSVPLLTLAGLIAGWTVFAIWGRDVGAVTVTSDEVLVKGAKHSATYAREEIAEIFMDKDELVLLDPRSSELSRTGSDATLAPRLAAAFRRFGYPWAGTTDPRDAEFTPWVDRSRDLDERAHELLRKRRRALADERTGAAEEAREQLLGLGVVVRDRGEEQQYRLVGRS